MSYDHKKVDKIGKVVVDSLMLVLLWAILILPATTFSLFKLDTSSQNVLSGQDTKAWPEITPSDNTKSYREFRSETGNSIEEINPDLDR